MRRLFLIFSPGELMFSTIFWYTKTIFYKYFFCRFVTRLRSCCNSIFFSFLDFFNKFSFAIFLLIELYSFFFDSKFSFGFFTSFSFSDCLFDSSFLFIFSLYFSARWLGGYYNVFDYGWFWLIHGGIYCKYKQKFYSTVFFFGAIVRPTSVARDLPSSLRASCPQAASISSPIVWRTVDGIPYLSSVSWNFLIIIFDVGR